MLSSRSLLGVFAILFASFGFGCGGSSNTSGGINSSGGTVPQFSHVVVVVEENAGYSDVIGSGAMPYLNSLAQQYSLATNYYGNTHPSIGNYFMMTTGTMVTNDDTFTGTVSVDNLVRQFQKDGKTWKSYAESLPSAGYIGGDSYPYLKRHVPFSYFSDVANSSALAQNILPFSQFASDVSSGNLPNFSFVTPNAEDDGHDCPGGGASCTLASRLTTADNWLKANIGPLISSSAFADTLLVIVFDEAQASDTSHGGGHVATVLISPKVKMGYQGSGLYQHQNLESLIGASLKLSAVPGAGSSAGSMGEFFQ
jgi:phosphatidylinositol-3-phosphatase